MEPMDRCREEKWKVPNIKGAVPRPTVMRLSRYRRVLSSLAARRVGVVSSEALAALSGVTPVQLRKDLSFFGRFGVRGVGYDVKMLMQELTGILGLVRPWPVVLVGTRLAWPFVECHDLLGERYRVVAAFDDSPHEVGRRLECGVEIRPLGEMSEYVQRWPWPLAVLGLDGPHVQCVAEELVRAGVQGILAIGGQELRLPPGVVLQRLDLPAALDALTFEVVQARVGEGGNSPV